MNLNEVANLSYNQIFPNPSDETPITKQEFRRTAFAEFAYQTLLMAWTEKRNDGFFNVPSYLLKEDEMDVVNNRIDISGLKILRSLPSEAWLQNIGGFNCSCKYIKSDINLTQLMCDDDSLDDSDKSYFVLGKEIVFPSGTHTNKLTIVYANSGEDIDGRIEIDDAIGSIVRAKLNEIYGGKIGKEDVTNNQNPEI